MAIDPTRQVVRQALLRELGRRAMAAGERAEWKMRERANPESKSEAPAGDEAEAGPDAGKRGPAAA